MPIVADISILLGLVLQDEDSLQPHRVIERIVADGAVEPCLFWFEIRNALLVNERRSRLQPSMTHEFLECLNDLEI